MDKLIKAIQAPKIQGVITPELSRILAAAYAAAGQQPQNLLQGVKVVERDIFEKFPGMTLPEVSYAIEQGVRGEYTEVTAVNVSNIYKWLKGYRQSSDRAMAIRKLQQGLGLKQVATKGTLTEGELTYRTYQTKYGCTHTRAQVIPNKIVFLDKIASPNHYENGYYGNNGKVDGYGY